MFGFEPWTTAKRYKSPSSISLSPNSVLCHKSLNLAAYLPAYSSICQLNQYKKRYWMQNVPGMKHGGEITVGLEWVVHLKAQDACDNGKCFSLWTFCHWTEQNNSLVLASTKNLQCVYLFTLKKGLLQKFWRPLFGIKIFLLDIFEGHFSQLKFSC